jgi:hypothetical protein
VSSREKTGASSDSRGQFDRDKVWARRDLFTGKASEIVRQLGFAGIALVWLFRIQGSSGLDVLPKDLRVPTILIVTSLAMDLLHYVWGSAAWGVFGSVKETQIKKVEDDWEKLKEAEPFRAPSWINYPTNFFFWGKIVVICAAYALMALYIGKRVF